MVGDVTPPHHSSSRRFQFAQLRLVGFNSLDPSG